MSRELSVACLGAMIPVDETPSPGSCDPQDAVPTGVGDVFSAENPRTGVSRIL